MPITFQQALEISGDTARTALLGNGFSIAGDAIFDYRSLLDRAQLNDNLKSIFLRLNTADFEIVIEQLTNSAKIVQLFANSNQILSEDLIKAAEILREQFAILITREHAEHDQVFRAETVGTVLRMRSCLKFLRNFTTIFTTNYDLLLYWAIMAEVSRSTESTMPTLDGFRWGGVEDTRIYDAEKLRNVYYLHGSLFLQQQGIDTLKIIRNGHNLLPTIGNNIQQNIMPLIILEGNSDSKLRRISEHRYLQNSLYALTQLAGDLFIFGHSLCENDQHIFDAINSSQNITRIFISAISTQNENRLSEVDADFIFSQAIRRFGNRENREIFIYDGHSANAWI